MAGNTITSDELNQFKNLPVKKKIDSMELYLIGINGCKYNMQEVAAKIFGNENHSYTVSLIHRCYNFSGQNGGKYRNGCKFEQTYRYRVTRADIEAFVRTYPDGTFYNGVTFEDFLKSRASGARAPQQQMQRTVSQQQQTQGTIPRQQAQKPVPQQKYSNQNMSYSNNNQMSADDDKAISVMVGFIGIVILVIMFRKGVLLEHWIISLIILIVSLVCFVG